MTQPNPPKEKKLLDQYRDVINLKHYSPRTGDTYIHWTKEYILFHNKRHPKEMGAPEINQFLTQLAREKNIRLHPKSSIERNPLSLPSRSSH